MMGSIRGRDLFLVVGLQGYNSFSQWFDRFFKSKPESQPSLINAFKGAGKIYIIERTGRRFFCTTEFEIFMNF